MLDTIRNRRTIRDFADKPVSNSDLELVIEAATWAPNHRHTEPWRFIVLTKDGEMRKHVAQLVHDWTYENVKNPTPERRINSANNARQEILDAPAFMYVYSLEGRNDEITQENYAATACAVQNLMLAAHTLELGVGWTTGRPCKVDVGTAIGAEPDWQMAGALFIGYPDPAAADSGPAATRKPVDEVTTWH